jgi:hypothetical protein
MMVRAEGLQMVVKTRRHNQSYLISKDITAIARTMTPMHMTLLLCQCLLWRNHHHLFNYLVSCKILMVVDVTMKNKYYFAFMANPYCF